MNCNWNKTWSNIHTLDECVWVACLKPPIPPDYTNLINTDWDGEPIPFDSEAYFACKRNYK